MTLTRIRSRIAFAGAALAMLAQSGCKKTPVAPVAVNGFTIVQGNNQVAQAGTLLPTPVVLRVIDINGDGIPNVTVVFAIATGGGTVRPPRSATRTVKCRSSGHSARVRPCSRLLRRPG